MTLYDAVQKQDLHQVRALLQDGADVNAPGPGGKTPLLEAAVQGNVALVTLLLEAKADPSLTDDERESPLLKAAAYGHREIVTLLVPHAPQEEVDMALAFLKAHGGSDEALRPRAPPSPPPSQPPAPESGNRWLATVAARTAHFFGDESAGKRLERLERAEKKKR